jgi:hypothetical protein
MASNLFAGILGGVQGASNAANQIATERMKELAEHLKMKALEEIQMRSDVRRHGQAKELQTERLGQESGLQEKRLAAEDARSSLERGSRETIAVTGLESREETERLGRESQEKIATDRNRVLKAIADEKNKIDERLRNTQENTEKNKRLKIQSDAAFKAMDLIAKGGGLEEAAAILDAAEVDYKIEEYVKEPAKEGGFLGWGKKPAILGERIKIGDKGKPGKESVEGEPTGATPTQGQGEKSIIQQLLDEGKKKTQPSAVSPKPTPGLLGEAGAATTEPVPKATPSPLAEETQVSKPGLIGKEQEPEMLTVGNMKVRKTGNDFEVFDEARNTWRPATGKERAMIEDAVYGRESPIQFSKEPVNIKQPSMWPTRK